jgi:hypothetical protein
MACPEVWARLAIFNKKLKDAETIYLEQNQLDEALSMYQRFHKWDEGSVIYFYSDTSCTKQVFVMVHSRLVFGRCLGHWLSWLRGFCGFPHFLQTNAYSVIWLCHDCFLPNAFQFTAHHSSHSSTLYRYWQHHKINHKENYVYHHHWQNSPFWAIAFLRRFFQICLFLARFSSFSCQSFNIIVLSIFPSHFRPSSFSSAFWFGKCNYVTSLKMNGICIILSGWFDLQL